MNNKYLIVLSGGLDSVTTLNVYVNKYGSQNVKAISFDFHSKNNFTFNNNNVELICSKYWTKKLNVDHFIIDVSYMSKILEHLRNNVSDLNIKNKEKPQTSMSFRNLQLLSIAAAYADINDCNKIVTGFQKQDNYTYWDTTNLFKDKFNEILKLNKSVNIELECPFINDNKEEEIRKGLELGIDYSTTWTCYNPIIINEINKIYPCRKCPSCLDRELNFKKLNMEDPLLKNGLNLKEVKNNE